MFYQLQRMGRSGLPGVDRALPGRLDVYTSLKDPGDAILPRGIHHIRSHSLGFTFNQTQSVLSMCRRRFWVGDYMAGNGCDPSLPRDMIASLWKHPSDRAT